MDVHISHSFGEGGGASIAASLRDGVKLGAGSFGWKHILVRKVMRLLCLPLDTSAGVIKYGLQDRLDAIKPDHVYIHWIGNEMLRYEELGCLSGIPVTIVLHDFSLFEVPPYRRETYFDRWRLRRIRRALKGLAVDYEAPSAWAARHICELVPDARVVIRRTPVRKEFNRMGNPLRQRRRDEPIRFLFGCQGGRANPYKGFSDLESALALLPQRVKDMMELHIFGESASECTTKGVRTIFHGIVSSAATLAALYRSCHALLFPSISETQGLVKDEALACGLPVIAFNRTACSEGITHKVDGYIADTVQEFADGIKWAMEFS